MIVLNDNIEFYFMGILSQKIFFFKGLYHYSPTRMTEAERLKIIIVNKNVEQLELS